MSGIQEKAYHKIDQASENYKYCFDNADPRNRKMKYLPDWVQHKSQLLKDEIDLEREPFKAYKRGTIIYVNLGSNIGSEFSGNHFCVVLNKKDNSKMETITVVPLSSKFNRQYAHLTSSIFDLTIEKLNNRVKDLQKELLADTEELEEMKKQHEKKVKNLSHLLSIGRINKIIYHKQLDNFTSKFDDYIKKCEIKSKNHSDIIKDVELVASKFARHQHKKSYANINAITTISKRRITKINEQDPTGNIKFSLDDMIKIDQQIKTRFLTVE